MPVELIGDSRRKVTETVPVKYVVAIEDDYFTNGKPDLVLGFQAPGRRVALIDHEVHDLYWDSRIAPYLTRHGIQTELLILSLTEEDKTLDTALRILDFYKAQSIPARREPIILIGGGVLMDVGSFVASLDHRGKPVVKICTTGQMWDCAIFGKTMVNYERKKSAVGSFHEPVASIIDRRFLATVPLELIRDAVAEQVKVAAIMDAELFGVLERHGYALVNDKFQGTTPELDGPASEAIARTIDGALEANGGNPRETSPLRRMLFGHTWGPFLEMQALKNGDPIRHGNGVAIDIALSAVLSWRLELLTWRDRDRVLNLLTSLGLPIRHALLEDAGLIASSHAAAAQARGDLMAPLMPGIGQCKFARSIPPKKVEESIQWLRQSA